MLIGPVNTLKSKRNFKDLHCDNSAHRCAVPFLTPKLRKMCSVYLTDEAST